MNTYTNIALDMKKSCPYYKEDVEVDSKIKKDKKPFSLIDAFTLMKNNEHVRYLAMILFCYNAAIVSVETCYKSVIATVGKETGNKDFALEILGKQYIFVGLLSIILGEFVRYAFSNLSWLSAAMINPLFLGSTGCLFFHSVIFPDFWSIIFTKSVMSNFFSDVDHKLCFTVLCGLILTVLVRSSKYVCFDSTKEDAFKMLPENMMKNVKGTLEVVGSRAGKSSGSLIQYSIIMPITQILFDRPDATLLDAAPLLFVVFSTLCTIWIYSTYKLSLSYEKLKAARELERLKT